jgi:hypothetical protein
MWWPRSKNCWSDWASESCPSDADWPVRYRLYNIEWNPEIVRRLNRPDSDPKPVRSGLLEESA